MEIKIGSLNLCLGLANKKDLVKQTIAREKIDILCLQETELNNEMDHNLLSFPGFTYETEKASNKSRVGIYINTCVRFLRRCDLEIIDRHVMIIDVLSTPKLRIINLYRSFNPPNNMSAREFFNNQLQLVRGVMTSNTILIGDFNLDWAKKGHMGYPFNQYFNDMDLAFEDLNIEQLVNSTTWTRTVGGIVRESTIDHIYSTNLVLLSAVTYSKPCFGDHYMIHIDYGMEQEASKQVIRRNWKHYSKERLNALLAEVDWNITDDSVQGFWNTFENKIIKIVDMLIPMSSESISVKKQTCTPRIKNLMNLRKRLVKKMRDDKSVELRCRVRTINSEIKGFWNANKNKQVRRTIKPGNSQSLWKAVKIAKDLNLDSLPRSMYEDDQEVQSEVLPDKFASFFHKKIVNLLQDVTVDEEVYNGNEKTHCIDSFFMDLDSVVSCMKSLKAKNSEGYDRIPQRVLVDGVDFLSAPMQKLMSLIYTEVKIPEQWLVSKTIPIFKNKGQKKDIENYRPIANLCSSSKIFEKLILRKILQIESEKNVDFTGKNQHGFKRKRSTSTLSADLLSQISRAIDNDEYVVLASLDMSSAFDLVNINLLVKRLIKIGLPSDIVNLISVWLRDRTFYVSIDGESSVLYDLLLGTVQGSILGPVLYAIFISPIFDIADLTAFADDKYVQKSNVSLPKLIDDIQKSLEAITKWLKKSGLIVNQGKTEACLFYKQDCAAVAIKVGEDMINTKKSINVLGVIFDTKLQWSEHVTKALQKANRSLNAIKMIRKFFSTKELVNLVTSNYYSILLYNSEIWHSANLNVSLKQKLLSASANALKMCLHYPQTRISHYNLHKMTNRATPAMYCKYKGALQIFKLCNEDTPEDEWIHLNFDIINTTRQQFFEVRLNHRLRVGRNALCNKLHDLNGKIPLDWLNLSFENFKIKCKKQFLSFTN